MRKRITFLICFGSLFMFSSLATVELVVAQTSQNNVLDRFEALNFDSMTSAEADSSLTRLSVDYNGSWRNRDHEWDMKRTLYKEAVHKRFSFGIWPSTVTADLLVIGDRVALLRFNQADSTWFAQRDSTALNYYLSLRPMEIKELEQDYSWSDIDFEWLVVGTGCGYGGQMPGAARTAHEMAEKGDIEGLVRMLISATPEETTLGYMGLDYARRQGYDLSESVYKAMESVRYSDHLVLSCQGCDQRSDGTQAIIIAALKFDPLHRLDGTPPDWWDQGKKGPYIDSLYKTGN